MAFSLVLRADGDPMALVEPGREVVPLLDPQFPFYGALAYSGTQPN